MGSRSTSFIGLTKAAQNFVEGLEKLDTDEIIKGMFGEEIPLGKWKMHPLVSSQINTCIREKVQCDFWSSGPCIFTYLEFDFGDVNIVSANPALENAKNKVNCYQWVFDPTLGKDFYQKEIDEEYGIREDGSSIITINCGKEYDHEKGTIWF